MTSLPGTNDGDARILSKKINLPKPAPTAASLLYAANNSNSSNSETKLYWDRSHYDSPESQLRALSQSSTLYIGNLAFSTRVAHLRALFANHASTQCSSASSASAVVPIRNILMGVHRNDKTPCGFAFVEYESREDALNAVAYLSGCKVDGRVIRVELDAGFKPGRQYGRGASGGQVRDDRRGNVDRGRSQFNQRGASRSPRGNGGGFGMSSNRWEAPATNATPTSRNNTNSDYAPIVGVKRGRDDDNDDNGRYRNENEEYGTEERTKNPRFHEGSDDEN